MGMWNFKDALSVPSQYWPWLAVALILGVIVGWMTCNYVEQKQ